MRLVPDELWALVEPLVPEFQARPQGGWWNSTTAGSDGVHRDRVRVEVVPDLVRKALQRLIW